MKILFIGDVMGRSGREALYGHLSTIKDTHQPDITIVNGENAAHGKGITSKITKQFFESGVDVITTGNHIWSQKEIMTSIESEKNLLRPLNLPKSNPGHSYVLFKTKSQKTVLVVNAMGRVFMDPVDDPFDALNTLLEKFVLKQSVDSIFVDFHAEATSEKMALAHYLDGRVTGVIGTHTHVPTADHTILPNGTAYMTDAGMTGDYNSVIGVKPDAPLQRFTTKIVTKPMSPAEGEATVCGAIINVDDETGLATDIQPIRVGGRLSQAGTA